MTATSSSNTYRKVRALIAKTVANGCTPGEAVSAANLASKIIADHNLDPARIAWPAPPAGYGWDGEPGRGGQMVERPKAEKPKPARKTAAPRGSDGERLADVMAGLRAQADAERKPRRARRPTAEPKAPRKTVGERLVEMLRRQNGVTIADIMVEFGVQAHSARALISVEARKKRGLAIRLDKATGRYGITVE